MKSWQGLWRVCLRSKTYWWKPCHPAQLQATHPHSDVNQVSSCWQPLLLEDAVPPPTLSATSRSSTSPWIRFRVSRNKVSWQGGLAPKDFETCLLILARVVKNADSEISTHQETKLNSIWKPRDESSPPRTPTQVVPQPKEDLDPRIFAPTGDIYRFST